MSAQDDINISDDDFDAFLKGEGELSLMLRQMPQVQPSATLDDAILHAAKVELAKTPVTATVLVAEPAQPAANDPIMPGSVKPNKPHPGFASRWRIPLGLAASLLVTVQLVRMEMHDEQSLPGAPQLLMEKAPAPDVRLPVKNYVLAEAPPSVSVKIVPPPGYEPPQGISAAPAAPAMTTEAIEAAQATAAAASQPQAKLKAMNAPLRADKDIAAPKVQASASPLTQSAPPVAEPAPALAPIVSSSPALPDTPAVAPPAPMPMTPMPARAVAPAQKNAMEDVAKAAKRESARPVADVAGSLSQNDAEAQLTKIDALLKAGSHKDALTAWRKFHEAYPNYPLSDDLRGRIDALLKESASSTNQ